jgi:hypothetical protein
MKVVDEDNNPCWEDGLQVPVGVIKKEADI